MNDGDKFDPNVTMLWMPPAPSAAPTTPPPADEPPWRRGASLWAALRRGIAVLLRRVRSGDPGNYA